MLYRTGNVFLSTVPFEEGGNAVKARAFPIRATPRFISDHSVLFLYFVHIQGLRCVMPFSNAKCSNYQGEAYIEGSVL